MSENKTLASELAKAQAEMTAAAFDAVNPHFKSKYATLASVIDAVRDPLTKHGISFIQRAIHFENCVGVETVFMGHGSEIATGVVAVPVDKKTAQGLGSALTYARRYSLAMACCISADEDDDGNAATASAPGKPSTIGSAELAVLQDAIADAGLTAEKFCRGYGIGAVAQLPAEKLDAALKVLSARAKKRAEAQAEA